MNELVLRARLQRANGATAHAINGLIAIVETSQAALHNNPADATIQAIARAANNRLFDFLNHGNYQKACEDNPYNER